MVRFLAILISALVMGGLVYVFGPFMLLAMPLIVVAILFAETRGGRQSGQKSSEASTTSTTSTTSTER